MDKKDALDTLNNMILFAQGAHMATANSAFHTIKDNLTAFKKDLEQLLQIEDGLNIAIEELDFSVRTVSCLKAEGILTLKMLLTKTELDLLKTPNFGRKSLDEVRHALTERGLRLHGR